MARMLRGSVFAALALLLLQLDVHASSALRGDRCRTAPYPKWTMLERAAWSQYICIGKSLDLSQRAPSQRVLSARFLEMLLLNDPWRAALPAHGVVIIGARFKTPIDLENAHITSDLSLTYSVFEGPLYLTTASVDGDLTFDGSWFAQDVNLEGIFAAKSLSFNDAQLRTANLTAAKVTSYVMMRNARVAGNLQLDGVETGGIDLRNSDLTELNLRRAKLAYGDLDDISVVGPLRLSDANISTTLFLRRSTIGFLDLIASKIGSNLELDGAWITSNLDLQSTAIGANLFMRDAELPGTAINGSKITNTLGLDRSRIAGVLDMRAMEIGSLSLSEVKADTIQLTGTRIGGGAQMNDMSVACSLDMQSVTGGSYLALTNLASHDVNLRSLNVASYVDIGNARVMGSLKFEDAKAGSALVLVDSQIGAVSLDYSKIGSNADLDNIRITDALSMENTDIGGNLFLRDVEFPIYAALIYLTTGDIWLSGSRLMDVDLSGSQIKGMLALTDRGGHSARWGGGGSLTLRNASAGLIQGRLSAWPQRLDLRDFEYKGFGLLRPVTNDISVDPEWQASRYTVDDMSGYSTDDFIQWIGRSQPFSPQPYEHLAGLLQKGGFVEKSKSVLFAAREGERGQTKMLAFDWWLKSSSLVFIGHSYRPYFILIWIVIFIAVGAAVASWSGEARRLVLGRGIAFSFDRLIPLVRLEERHYQVRLIPGVRAYFYFHQIMGYVFGSFLLAWLSGIVK